MKTWILLVALYGIFKGFREILKKQALKQNSVAEVLFYYTFIGFILILPFSHDIFDVSLPQILYIFLKSIIIFAAWICSFNAIKRLPASLYCVMDLASVLFASMLGIVVMHDTLTTNQILGFAIVILGLLLVNFKKSDASIDVKVKYIILLLFSCFLNGVSSVMDKQLMRDVSSGQLQFWYMLFLSVLYLAYMLLSKSKVDFRVLKSNYSIVILSVLFIIADRALFIANSYSDSSVTAMTLIKQCSVFVTIILSRIVYKEKNILYRLICASVVILGIVISVCNA